MRQDPTPQRRGLDRHRLHPGRRGRRACPVLANQPRPEVPKHTAPTDEAEENILPSTHFPAPHRAKLHSTNPIERRNGAIKGRTNVLGILPHEAAVIRPLGAGLLEQANEWATQRSRQMTPQTISAISASSNPQTTSHGCLTRPTKPPKSYTTHRDTLVAPRSPRLSWTASCLARLYASTSRRRSFCHPSRAAPRPMPMRSVRPSGMMHSTAAAPHTTLSGTARRPAR